MVMWCDDDGGGGGDDDGDDDDDDDDCVSNIPEILRMTRVGQYEQGNLLS